MKIIFGIDITGNRKSTEQDGEEFIAEKITDELRKKIDEKIGAIEQLDKRAALPLPLRTVRVICGYSAFIVLAVWISFLSDGENIMKEVPWLIYATAAALAVWAVLVVISCVRRKDVCSSAEYETAIKEYSESAQKCLDYLGVNDEEMIDVMRLKYKRKPDGSIKIIQMEPGKHFINMASVAFCLNGCLCLTDHVTRFDIPISEMTGIRKIDRRVCLSDWNKKEKWNRGEYSQYNIKLASGGGLIIQYYYALCISHGGEDYGLYFAPYDLDAVMRLTGITEIAE